MALARIGLGFQVRAQADLVAVAAGVGVVGGVQRLVNVADEVDDELERVAAGLDRLAPVGEDGQLLLDRADHAVAVRVVARGDVRSEEHTSELQSLMRISYAVFCLKKKKSISLN